MVILFTQTANMWRRAGSYRIATALRNKGVDVQVIDFLNHWDINTLISLLDKLPIDWVGFTATYSHYGQNTKRDHFEHRITDLDYNKELQLINFFRQKNIQMIIGGSNVDNLKNHLSEFYLTLGQGDNAVIAFHNHIVKGEPLEYTITEHNSKLLLGDENFAEVDLNDIGIEWHADDFIEKDELLPIEIARGCIFKCKYCQYPYIGKKQGTYIRPKEKIQQEIIASYSKFGVKRFLFQDDTFNDDIEKMRMIRDIRIDSKIDFEFWSYGRLDLLRAHPEMIDLIGEIGWAGISFGVETFNKQNGSLIGKGLDPEKQKETLLALRARYPNLYISILLIVGLPYDTKESIKETVDWCIDNNMDSIMLSPLFIKNANQTSFTSTFDKNPEKFGFAITVMKDKGNRISYTNKNWTREDARSYTLELRNYCYKRFNQKGKKNKGYPGHTAYERMKNRFEMPANVKWNNFNDGIDYIKNKTELIERLIKLYETRRIC